MMCAWKEFLSIIPTGLRREVDELGREKLQELRLRINSPPELIIDRKSQWLSATVSREELDYVINAASRYSPWCSSTISQGYLTAPGGHRIGVCGEAIFREGKMTGIKQISSLCIRIARDISGVVRTCIPRHSSILILGAPGWGKTTLLRDLIREISQEATVATVDERGELFPNGFTRGKRLDVLTGCRKETGISMLLRTMSPEWIAVDEITEEQDCIALNRAANCGVKLMATAHAGSFSEFRDRNVYRSLIREGTFRTIVCLNEEKHYHVEEGIPCISNGSVQYS